MRIETNVRASSILFNFLLSNNENKKWLIPVNVFLKSNIDFMINEFHPKVYSQINGEFISHLSIIDILFNIGFNDTANYINPNNV